MLIDQVSGSSCGRKVLHSCHGSWFLESFSWSTSPHTLPSTIKDRPMCRPMCRQVCTALAEAQCVQVPQGQADPQGALASSQGQNHSGGVNQNLLSLSSHSPSNNCVRHYAVSLSRAVAQTHLSLRLCQFCASQKGIPLWRCGDIECREYLQQKKPGLGQTVSGDLTAIFQTSASCKYKPNAYQYLQDRLYVCSKSVDGAK